VNGSRSIARRRISPLVWAFVIAGAALAPHRRAAAARR
jgi:hypothetical protein